MKKFLLLFAMLSVLFGSGCVSLEKMQKDADKGDEVAQVLLGLKYFYGSSDVRMIQYEEALRYFKMAAKQENPLACYYLGEIYEKGLGQTEVDYFAAEEYYKRAAKTMDSLSGVMRRHSYLASAKMYDFGNGVKKSDNHAKYYYEKALKDYYDKKVAKVYDFSERHMDYATSKTFKDAKNTKGFAREVGDGGLLVTGLAYLTNGQGAVLEEQVEER